MSWTQAQLGHKEGKNQFFLQGKAKKISEKNYACVDSYRINMNLAGDMMAKLKVYLIFIIWIVEFLCTDFKAE